jgi:hypothetical protein
MSGRYIQREVVPAISEFQKNYALDPFTVDPVLEPSEDPEQR